MHKHLLLNSILITCIFFISQSTNAFAEAIKSVNVDPLLDISLFAPYTLKVDTTGTPKSVAAVITGINGDGGAYWNYYANGTPASEAYTRTLTFDKKEGKWITDNIRPDTIYPEIYFANSKTTWENPPQNINIRKNNYHIMHYSNPFSMVKDMNFFIEINAKPKSQSNSSDLQVYIVKNDTTVNFFNSDWRSSKDVELISTFGKNIEYNHSHTDNSSHLVVSLKANADGTFGKNNLDLNKDFWVVLYSDAPSIERGWDLKYQPSTLCNNNNNWYSGETQTWSTYLLNGCPDNHIHIARRNNDKLDGFSTVVVADYGNEITTSTKQSFYFQPLPNLAPNNTSFISPLTNGTYDGDFDDTILIEWNPASDANNSQLTYTIQLVDISGNVIQPPIISNTAFTNFLWDINNVKNDTYSLKGIVCDKTIPTLCSEFNLPGKFIINKDEPIYKLSDINISSTNINSGIAQPGDVVKLTFTTSGDISPTTQIDFYSGGIQINKPITMNRIGNEWTVEYEISPCDPDGIIDFTINADNLDKEYTSSTNGSYVLTVSSIANTTFNDININSSQFQYICNLKVAGIITGYSDGSFHPGANVTRGQLASFVVKAFKLQSINNQSQTIFSDSIEGPHKLDIETLNSLQIINGFSDNTFRSEDPVTRAEASKIIYNTFKLLGLINTDFEPTFPDIENFLAFKNYIGFVQENGIMTGEVDGNFMPNSPLKRDQMAKVIAKSMELM